MVWFWFFKDATPIFIHWFCHYFFQLSNFGETDSTFALHTNRIISYVSCHDLLCSPQNYVPDIFFHVLIVEAVSSLTQVSSIHGMHPQRIHPLSTWAVFGISSVWLCPFALTSRKCVAANILISCPDIRAEVHHFL